MVAIIKKEFLTYFKSMTGYVFMASLLFFVGLFFVTNNLLILNLNIAACSPVVHLYFY